MPVILAQVALQGASQLPRDVFVNTFHFNLPLPPLAADYAAIEQQLENFYNVPGAPGRQAVAGWIGAGVSRSANAVKVKMYNLSDLRPRPIVNDDTWTLGPAGNQLGDFPSEVAVTVSYFAGVNAPRRRGRIYLGPLIDDSGTLQPNVRVATTMRLDLAASAAKLRDESTTGGTFWSVYSLADGIARPVTGGWVDNEFDTQRRRGLRSDARTVW